MLQLFISLQLGYSKPLTFLLPKMFSNEAGLSDLVRKLGHFILLGQDGVLGIHFLKGILQIFHKN